MAQEPIIFNMSADINNRTKAPVRSYGLKRGKKVKDRIQMFENINKRK